MGPNGSKWVQTGPNGFNLLLVVFTPLTMPPVKEKPLAKPQTPRDSFPSDEEEITMKSSDTNTFVSWTN